MTRPREAGRASDRLTHRQALDRIVPALTTLRTVVRNGSDVLSREEAEQLLIGVFEDIDLARVDDVAMQAMTAAAETDPVAGATLAYINATRKMANVAAARAVIERTGAAVSSEQANALLDLIVAAGRSPGIPTYMEDIVDELLKAGVTKNGLTAAQRNAIIAIVSNPNHGKGKRVAVTPDSVGPKPVVAASWTSLPDPVPGFTFARRKVGRNAHDRAVLEAGLPPATSIDFFVSDGSFTLANIEGNRDKANFAWRSIDRWLADSGTNDFLLDNHRKAAWVFLLGHVHGFLPGVTKIDRVPFASPWANDEVIEARRVVEAPASSDSQ